MKPFLMLSEVLEAEHDQGGEENSIEFLEARAEFVAAIWKASGSSQQDFSQAIRFSPAYGQRILSQGFEWGGKERAITTALGLPPGCLATETAARTFVERNTVFITALDSLVHHNSAATRAAKATPTAYILQKIEGLDDYPEMREEFTEYFSNPDPQPEPEDPVSLAVLEGILDLPVNGITNPDAVSRLRSRVARLSIDTRRTIAANVAAEMEKENLSAVELATRAGIPESAVVKLLGLRAQCTMTTLFGIASALSVEPAWLMTRAVKPDPATNAEQVPPENKKDYEDLPLVARSFLSDYLQLIREKDGREISGPSGLASSVLVLTPLLHYAVKLIEKNADSLYSDEFPMNLAGVMGNLEKKLRVMTAPMTAP
jgi:transcriptional regulator with XRE-family HTH domain